MNYSPKKRITLADVAARAKVDKSTASLVLNGRALASRLLPETRQRILDAAQELQYRPSIAARELNTGKSGILAMVLGDIENIYFSSMAAAFIKHAQEANYQALVSVTGYDLVRETEALRMLYDRNVDGVFYTLHSIESNQTLLDTLLSAHFPIVLYGSRNSQKLSRFLVDCTEALDEAVGRLAPRHRQIGVFCYPGEWPGGYATFQAACRKHDVEPVCCFIEATDAQKLEEEMFALVTHRPELKAWFVSGPAAAMRLTSRLIRAGFRIPQQIELVCFWDTAWCGVNIPTFSTIAFDMELAMRKVVARLQNYAAEGPRSICLNGHFISRETTL